MIRSHGRFSEGFLPSAGYAGKDQDQKEIIIVPASTNRTQELNHRTVCRRSDHPHQAVD